MSLINAPVALFAYARPNHLQQTVKSLQNNQECSNTRLYVFCDGPKHEGHTEQVKAVRAFVDKIQGFESVIKIFRNKNLGLSSSIISGVGELVARYGSVIVVEDDLVVSPYFLGFMNEGLSAYRDDQRVASIHGYSYPVSESLPDTFFLRGADCWGWATWSRAWNHFEPDGNKLLEELKRTGLRRSFDLDGAYPFTRMLRNQVDGKNDSWAVRWHASCFLRNMLTLYPSRSLVDNIGFDSTGTHCNETDVYAQTVTQSPVQVRRQELIESSHARAIIANYFKRNHSIRARALQRIKVWFGRRS